MDVINKRIHVLFLLALLTAFGNGFAQTAPATPGKQQVLFHFDKPITLDSLTRYVHSRSKVRFSFNSTKVKGRQVINLKKGAYTIELLLQQIRKHTSLYYSMYNGYVIFQDNPPKPKTSPVQAVKKTNPKPAGKTTSKPPVRRTKPFTTANAPQADTVKKAEYAPILIASIPPVIVPVASRDTINRPTAPTQPPALIAARPAATAQNTSTSNDAKETAWRWRWGLQWKGTIPLHGAQYYFTGTNTRSEPFNLLIPGIWLSATSNNKHEIMLLVKPAEWYFYNRQSFAIDSGLFYKNFDTFFVRKNTRLIKTGGWYGSLQYNYHINEHWITGAGIGYHLLTRGLAYQQITRMIDGSFVADSLFSMKNNSTTGQYLSPSFITGKLELAYKFRAIDLGATLLMPLTEPYRDKSIIKNRPLNLQLLLRWRIKRPKEE